jgi:GAF domain-containing protein
MNAALNTRQALDQTLARLLEVLNLASGKVYLLDRDTQQMTLIAARSTLLDGDDEERTITPGECLCGIAAQTGETLLATNVVRDQRIIRTECLRHGHSACAAVPLLARDQMLGVLHVAGRDDATFSPSGMALLRSVGAPPHQEQPADCGRPP